MPSIDVKFTVSVLLKHGFIRKRAGSNNQVQIVLYTSNSNSVCYITKGTFGYLEKLSFIRYVQRDKKYILDKKILSSRSVSGNNWVKRAYKKHLKENRKPKSLCHI